MFSEVLYHKCFPQQYSEGKANKERYKAWLAPLLLPSFDGLTGMFSTESITKASYERRIQTSYKEAINIRWSNIHVIIYMLKILYRGRIFQWALACFRTQL